VWCVRLEKERGVSVVVGAFGVRNFICARPWAEGWSGMEWIAAYVKVSGFINSAMGAGMRVCANRAMTAVRRLGSMRIGSRMSKASSVEKEIVPKMVVVAWEKAAETTSRDGIFGLALRWKYHCETVAAVVERWMPLIIERVQMYMSTKYTASHQLVESMMNFVKEDVRWPPRKTRVNIPSHIHVQITTVATVANPSPRSPGFAAKILQANSKIPIAFVRE